MESIRKLRVWAALVATALILSCIPAFAAETDTAALGTSGEIIEFLEPAPDAASMSVPLDTAAADLDLPGELAALVCPLEVATPSEPVTEEAMDIPVTWQAAPEYDAGVAGAYIFTAVIPQGYSLADGVEAPQITVTVAADIIDNAAVNLMASGPVAVIISQSNGSEPGGGPAPGVTVVRGYTLTASLSDASLSATFDWFMTETDNIKDYAPSKREPYEMIDPNDAVSAGVTDNAELTTGDEHWGKVVFCIATLTDGTKLTSTLHRVAFFPAMIGDMIVDYGNNTLTAPLKKNEAGNDEYGQHAAQYGSMCLLNVENAYTDDEIETVIEEQEVTYDPEREVLTAEFDTPFADVPGFFMSVGGGDRYFAIRRETNGLVPEDHVVHEDAITISLTAGSGNGEIPLTGEYVSDLIDRMRGIYGGSKGIILVMQTGGALPLDADVVKAAGEADAFYIKMTAANLTVNNSLLQELGEMNNNVELTAVDTDLPGNIDAAAGAIIGGRPVIDLALTSGGTPLTIFREGGTVKVSVPYALVSGEDPADIVVYYVKDDGTTEAVTGAAYADGFVTFTTPHFSTFAVGHKSSGGTSTPPSTPTPVRPSNNDDDDDDSDSGSGGGSGSRGSSTTASGPSNVTTAAANSAVNSAIAAAQTSGAAAATARLTNPGNITLAVLQAMARQAETTPLKVNADSIVGNAVDVRITLDPAQATAALNLSASTINAAARNVNAIFDTFFSNDVMTVALGQQGSFGMSVQIAVKLDPTLKTDNLVFYTYNRETNTFTRIAAPTYWVDLNGYVHFATTLGGNVVISDGELEKR